jgi:hypothetical protein
VAGAFADSSVWSRVPKPFCGIDTPVKYASHGHGSTIEVVVDDALDTLIASAPRIEIVTGSANSWMLLHHM